MGHTGEIRTVVSPPAVALAIAVLAGLPKAAAQPSEAFQDRLGLFEWWVLILMLGVRIVLVRWRLLQGRAKGSVLNGRRLFSPQGLEKSPAQARRGPVAGALPNTLIGLNGLQAGQQKLRQVCFCW